MESMSALVRENLEKAQETQKRWYDKNARQRVFNEGDSVLVLLPTSTNALMAQWQGPYEVLKQVGKVTYCINMHDRRKRKRIFMLREFFQDSSTQVAGWAKDIEVDVQDEIPVWRELGSGTFSAEDIHFGEQLTAEQRGTLRALLGKFSSVISNTPGQTTLAEHRNEMGTARPVKLPPYRIPHAYRGAVEKEMEMLEEGIIEPSMSEWCSPIVPVKKKDGSLRLCVDYRRLNSVSQSDAYPMPRVDDLIDQLGGAYYITTMDLTRGYWQVPSLRRCQAEDVETDHRALLWMDRVKDSNSRLTRWSLSLQPFDFTITHRKGPKNGNADGLSRMPWGEDAATELAAEEGGSDVEDCMGTSPPCTYARSIV